VVAVSFARHHEVFAEALSELRSAG
jgi:hypothetical protein